jgi:anhydro-N-acetylmuramic acid kinase
MNPDIQRLYQIAHKPRRLIIGLMSGTSLDGLDIALCRFTGCGTSTQVEVLAYRSIHYQEAEKQEIRKVFSKREADLQQVCLLNAWIGRMHAQMVNDALQEWGYTADQIDAIASHGQTIYHAPKRLHGLTHFPDATLQIGDGDHIATLTGIITLSDFRQKHVAGGGEGAPLAVYGDYILFSKGGEDRILLNIGGIANFTYLPGNLDTSLLFSTDVGPGNTLIDAYVRKHFNRPYDEGGEIAAQGKINIELLQALKAHPFFMEALPKSTGPELFSMAYVEEAQQKSQATAISPQDLVATLTRLSAECIADAISNSSISSDARLHLYMSGGGMHNTYLTNTLRELLPHVRINTTEALHISPDAKEAVLFATLANEALAGEGSLFGNGRPGLPGLQMGKISLPS